MDLRKIVSQVDRFTNALGRESRRRRKDIITLGEKKALRKMRRRAIMHCILERENIFGQDMAIYTFISSIYDDKKDVCREYNYYKEVKHRMLAKYGIEY